MRGQNQLRIMKNFSIQGRVILRSTQAQGSDAKSPARFVLFSPAPFGKGPGKGRHSGSQGQFSILTLRPLVVMNSNRLCRSGGIWQTRHLEGVVGYARPGSNPGFGTKDTISIESE